MSVTLGPSHPIALFDEWGVLNTAAAEQLAQWLEQRGIRIPVGQIVGYQRDLFFCQVQKVATQTITSGSDTVISFDTTVSDEQKAFDGTSTIVIPYNGVYFASASVFWDTNLVGARRAYFVTSAGGGTSFGWDDRFPTNAAGAGSGATLALPFKASKSDAIQLLVRQESGANRTVTASLTLALLNPY